MAIILLYKVQKKLHHTTTALSLKAKIDKRAKKRNTCANSTVTECNINQQYSTNINSKGRHSTQKSHNNQKLGRQKTMEDVSRGGSEECQYDTWSRSETYCPSHWPVVWHRCQRSTHEGVFEYLMQEEGRRRGKIRGEHHISAEAREKNRRKRDKSKQTQERTKR